MTISDFNNKYKKVKIIIGCLGIVGMLFYIYFLQNQAKDNKNRFYNKEFSTIIVSSNLYQGRSMEFHLKNGLQVYFMPPVNNKIMINDSIKKVSNTYLYNVYRKNNDSKYLFFATYDFTRFY